MWPVKSAPQRAMPRHPSQLIRRIPGMCTGCWPQLSRREILPRITSIFQSTPTAALNLLVVDDNRDAAESCAMLLELSGHHVRTAFNARPARSAQFQVEPLLHKLAETIHAAAQGGP
jgi:hypothetical protein